MKNLTIRIGADQTGSYKARVLQGTPPEMGTLYVILRDDGTDDGKSVPKVLTLSAGRSVNIVAFDCVEVVDSRAFGYVYVTQKRSGEIGEFVSFA